MAPGPDAGSLPLSLVMMKPARVFDSARGAGRGRGGAGMGGAEGARARAAGGRATSAEAGVGVDEAGPRVADPDVGVGDAKHRLQRPPQRRLRARRRAPPRRAGAAAGGDLARQLTGVVDGGVGAGEEGARGARLGDGGEDQAARARWSAGAGLGIHGGVRCVVDLDVGWV